MRMLASEVASRFEKRVGAAKAAVAAMADAMARMEKRIVKFLSL